MTTVYHGLLQDGRIEWTGAAPPVPVGAGVPVEVRLVLPTPEQQERGRRMAEALEKLASSNRIAELIPHPVAWQREQRKDRPLLGRDDE